MTSSSSGGFVANQALRGAAPCVASRSKSSAVNPHQPADLQGKMCQILPTISGPFHYLGPSPCSWELDYIILSVHIPMLPLISRIGSPRRWKEGRKVLGSQHTHRNQYLFNGKSLKRVKHDGQMQRPAHPLLLFLHKPPHVNASWQAIVLTQADQPSSLFRPFSLSTIQPVGGLRAACRPSHSRHFCGEIIKPTCSSLSVVTGGRAPLPLAE